MNKKPLLKYYESKREESAEKIDNIIQYLQWIKTQVLLGDPAVLDTSCKMHRPVIVTGEQNEFVCCTSLDVWTTEIKIELLTLDPEEEEEEEE